MEVKPKMSFWQIWNMSFGFLGIQYGFGLQQANMSPIYRYLGADEASIPGLWLAGPLTGLLLQPIIGALSDKSWSSRFGRRKPYVFIGAIVGSIAMILMPNSTSVLMAACLMWLLDAGLNSSMEPFRAFVGDMLNEKQRPVGYSVQSFMVGFGQTLANLMPFILPIIGISMAMTAEAETLAHGIPNAVRYPFYIGAAGILFTVFWTMYTTQEHPPVNDDYKKPKFYTNLQLKNINFWHLAMTDGSALLAGLFAIRLGYLGKVNDQISVLRSTKWSEVFASLKTAFGGIPNLDSINEAFLKSGASHEKIGEFLKSMKSAGADSAKLTELTQPFVAYSKEVADFSPTGEQYNSFLMHGLQNGLIWASAIGLGLYIILKLNVFKEILASLSEMPTVMKQLWWVKFFTWYGLPLMWQYLSLSVAKYAFNAPSPDANLIGFQDGSKWGGLCFAMFSITCFIISIFIPTIVKMVGSRRLTHAIFLSIGAFGFFLTLLSNDKMIYLVGMGFIGLAWGSIMSLPYLMLANAVKGERMGVYMGIFNGFICVPQFIGMLTVPLFYKSLLGDDPRNALILAGICLLLAAASCFFVSEDKGETAS
jgi:MFS-type transporter involved in bile tolerance (Atg22 family)